MPEVLRGGQGYSTAFPKKGDIVIRNLPAEKNNVFKVRRPKHHHHRNIPKPTPKPPEPTVVINNDTVKINGQGYSVAPSLQAEFIKQRTGGHGQSAQRAIQQAIQRQKQLEEQKQLQRQKQIEAQKILKEQKLLDQGYKYNQGTIKNYGVKNFEYNQQLINTRTKQLPKASESLVTKEGLKKRYKQSWTESTKQSISNLGYNVKHFFTGKNHKYKNVLDPFKYSGEMKINKPIKTSINPFYPEIAGVKPAVPMGFIITKGKKTWGKAQLEIESKRNKLISEIPITNNETLWKSQVSDIYEKYPDIPNLYERTGAEVERIAPAVIDIGVTAGLSAVATPLAAGGYMTLRGSSKISSGSKKDIYSGTERYPGIAKFSEESKSGGHYIIGGILSNDLAIKHIRRDIDKLEFLEFLGSDTKTIGNYYKINNENWLKTITRQATQFYKSETITHNPIFIKSNGRFNIGSGEATLKFKLFPFSERIRNGDWISGELKSGIYGRGTIDRVIINNIQLPKKYSATMGEATIIQKQIKGDLRLFNIGDFNHKTFNFIGIHEDIGKAYKGVGGNVNKLRTYAKIGGDLVIDEDSIYIPLKRTAIAELKDTSIIFKEPRMKEGNVMKEFGLKITKTGSKSSKNYFENLYGKQILKQESRKPVLTGYGSSTHRELTKLITVPEQPSINKLLGVSKYYGTGQYEKTYSINVKTPTKTSIIKQASSIVPISNSLDTKQLLKTKLDTKTTLTHRSKNRNKLRQETISKNLLKQSEILETNLKATTRQLFQLGTKTPQKQKNILKGAPSNPPRIKYPPRINYYPDFGIGGNPSIDLPYLKRPKKRIKDIDLFNVQIRRRGKFKTIGSDLSLSQAMKLGITKTKSTLARTFKIKKTGKKKQVSILDEGFIPINKKIFRDFKIKKGKKEKLSYGTFIQKAPYSLSSLGEVKEIQALRNQKLQLNKLINI